MTTPLPLIPLLEPIRPQMEQVRRLLQEALSQVQEPLRAMLHHSLDGGKQLRPALVILTGQVFDAPPAAFHRLAVAVDMLHAATLIHDDLVDGSPLRRGRETLHVIWPAGATVLAGDYLLGEATALIAELESPRVLKVFAGILRTMCSSEIKRVLATNGGANTPPPAPDREDYYRNIEAKTASLFAATLEMTAILAGVEERQIEALRRFGWELGIAFQIVDDVLDFASDAARLGKPAGSDLRQGLITLPVLYYLEGAADQPNAVSAVLAGRRDEAHVRAAIEAVCASGALEAALAEARDHTQRGHAALASLPDTPPRQILHALADYIIDRNH